MDPFCSDYAPAWKVLVSFRTMMLRGVTRLAYRVLGARKARQVDRPTTKVNAGYVGERAIRKSAYVAGM